MKIKDTDTWKALNNGGWTYRRLEDNDCLDKDERNLSFTSCAIADSKRNVAVKRIEAPEFGTYRVEVHITAQSDIEGIEGMTLFAGRRNMIAQNISIAAGSHYKKSFHIAVTPYIPALTADRYEDRTIYISYTHADLVEDIKVSVQRKDVPVIWVAGDSTLTDQNAGIPYYPYGSCAGWAQTISRFVKTTAVCNLAHSGMTSNCFRDDGHFDIAKEMMKPGDLFIVQFGHNDQKRRNLAAFGGYRDNLIRYVNEVRKLGALPIICSPISRISTDYSLLQPYADACREIAEELKVTFIDLHDYTFRKWTELSDNAKDYFIPGDITHTNEYGAVLIGNYFASEIMKSAAEADKHFDGALIENTGNFIPDEEEKNLPKELPGPDIFSIEPPYVDIRPAIPEYEGIKKAFRYGLLDPCVMHIHPYAVMPRAQLLMVMFKAFGLSGKRPYENKFKDITDYDWDAGYVQKLVDENLIDEQELCFRPDDSLTYAELASFIVRFLEKDKDKRSSKMSFQMILKYILYIKNVFLWYIVLLSEVLSRLATHIPKLSAKFL